MSRRKIVIHNHIPARARDATMGTYCEHCGWKAGSHQQGTMNCPIKGPGSGFKPDQKFSPVKETSKDRRATDVNAFEHNVSREEEEANRDKSYRDSGIVRVLADGGPGSGPQPGGGSHPEVEKHLNSDPSKMDKPALQKAYGEVSRLIAKRAGSVKNWRGSREDTLLNGHLAEIGNALKKANDKHPPIYRANDRRRK
jgi:hypothetical protein